MDKFEAAVTFAAVVAIALSVNGIYSSGKAEKEEIAEFYQECVESGEHTKFECKSLSSALR